MNHDPADLPVILLYNLDRSWPPTDVDEILNLVQDLATDLSTVGHPTQTICLDDESLERVMAGYDPDRHIVFNWCEEVPGIPRSSALIQVKSGHVKSGDIRDLHGVVDREEAAIGVFVTLETPTQDMVTEAVSAGYFQSRAWQKDYARIQIFTVEDLLAGKGIEMPPSAYGTFKQAGKVRKEEGKQGELGI